MKKKRVQRLTDDEKMFVTTIRHLAELCPPKLRMVAIFYHPDAGPLIIGSCCDGCTTALVRMAADLVPDPGTEEGLGATVH